MFVTDLKKGKGVKLYGPENSYKITLEKILEAKRKVRSHVTSQVMNETFSLEVGGILS